MARRLPSDFKHGEAQLVIEKTTSGASRALFTPSDETLREAKLKHGDLGRPSIPLLKFHEDGALGIFPINTLPTHTDFLKPKYEQIREIRLEGFTLSPDEAFDDLFPEDKSDDTLSGADLYAAKDVLEELPSGFIKDFEYGLGILKDYTFIVDFVEENTNATILVVSKNRPTGNHPQENLFIISWADFDKIRRMLNRITDRARSGARQVKVLQTHNFLAPILAQDEKQLPSGLNWLIGEKPTKQEVQSEAIAVITKSGRAIAKKQPQKLIKLRDDIELVTLEQLIEKFEEMLPRKLKEDRWQDLLNENAFILSLAFGHPIIKVQGQASVGGRKLSGAGDKITDFVAKNSMTNNIAIIEIKKPATALLNKRPYRDSTYTASAELSGAITQVLDQRQKLQTEIANIRYRSGINDIEAHAIHCALIVGTMPADPDRKKSLELFRRNSKDVEIITFDELLEKLKQLHQFLQSEEAEPSETTSP